MGFILPQITLINTDYSASRILVYHKEGWPQMNTPAYRQARMNADDSAEAEWWFTTKVLRAQRGWPRINTKEDKEYSAGGICAYREAGITRMALKN